MHTSALLTTLIASLAASSPIANNARGATDGNGFIVNDFDYTITQTSNWTMTVSNAANQPPYHPSFSNVRCTGYSGKGFIASECTPFNDNATVSGSSRSLQAYVDSFSQLQITYTVDVPTSYGHVDTFYYEGNKTVAAKGSEDPTPSGFVVPQTRQSSSAI